MIIFMLQGYIVLRYKSESWSVFVKIVSMDYYHPINYSLDN